jgi:hypothetical protein
MSQGKSFQSPNGQLLQVGYVLISIRHLFYTRLGWPKR